MPGVLLLLSAALLWSSGGALIKLVDAHPMAVSAGRSGIAVLLLICLTRRVPLAPSRATIRCGIFYAFTVVSFVVATKLTTAANAIVLQYAAPVYVALLSARFLGEPVNKRDWVAIVMVLLGMLVFFADGLSMGSNVGNLVAVFSGISFALLVVSLRQIHNQTPADAVIIGNVFAFLAGFPWLAESSLNSSSCVGIALLGVFQLGLSYFLYTKAIGLVTALEAVLIPVIEPLLNPVWVYFMHGEMPTRWAIVGAGVVLGAVTWRALAPLSLVHGKSKS